MNEKEKARTLKMRARALRRESTDAERLLWSQLRDRRMAGFKFRRQVVIAPYVVDFACAEARLIVEADGGQHAEREEEDRLRTAFLEQRGYKVLRFWNHEVLSSTEAVLEVIQRFLSEAPSPQPSPRGRGRRTSDGASAE